MTYRGFFVSEPISIIEVSFERALKTESNKVRMKSIQHLGTELQTFENQKREGDIVYQAVLNLRT